MAKQLVTSTIVIDDCEYTVDGYVIYSVDDDYGSDADGNRGVIRTTVEEVQNVEVYDEEGTEVDLDKEEKEQAEQILIDKFKDGI